MTIHIPTPPRRVVRQGPQRPYGRIEAAWTRHPRTGRLVQSWREADDQERSCTGRPGGPRTPDLRRGRGFARAA